jgi:hypothetical protein
MYCPSCGVETGDGIRYCKRCGAGIGLIEEHSGQRRLPIPLIITFLIFIAGIFSLGIGLPFGNAGALIRMGFSTRDVMLIFAADFGVTVTIVGMLVWLLARLLGVYQATEPRATAVLRKPAQLPLIEAAPQAVGSVTENTTRTLQRAGSATPRSLDNLG